MSASLTETERRLNVGCPGFGRELDGCSSGCDEREDTVDATEVRGIQPEEN